jgi:hypothetical protein
VLVDLAVCPALLELLVSVVRSVLAVQVVLLAHLVSVVPPEEEVCPEPMDPLDLKVFIKSSPANVNEFLFDSKFVSQVKMVIEDQLVLTDPKEKSETQVVLDLLVCKDFAVFQAELDLPASLVALENVVYPVLMAKTENRDPKVSKVFPDLLVFPENAVLW